MIGQLITDGHVMLTLSDAGVWEVPADAEEEVRPILQSQANILNVMHNPHQPEPGDHHFQFGGGSLMRAAQQLGCEYELAKPNTPLPEGAVS